MLINETNSNSKALFGSLEGREGFGRKKKKEKVEQI